MAKKKTESENQISFEESFGQLQEIVANLEDGNLSLSESLQNYETGIKRLKECYSALNEAEQKIRQLAEIDEDGNLVTNQFDPDSSNKKKDSKRTGTGNKSKKPSKKSTDADELFWSGEFDVRTLPPRWGITNIHVMTLQPVFAKQPLLWNCDNMSKVTLFDRPIVNA